MIHMKGRGSLALRDEVDDKEEGAHRQHDAGRPRKEDESFGPGRFDLQCQAIFETMHRATSKMETVFLDCVVCDLHTHMHLIPVSTDVEVFAD